MRKKDQKSVTLNLQEDLYHALKCISAEHKMTMTEVISRYIEYLRKQRTKKKEMLNEQSQSDFSLDK